VGLNVWFGLTHCEGNVQNLLDNEILFRRVSVVELQSETRGGVERQRCKGESNEVEVGEETVPPFNQD